MSYPLIFHSAAIALQAIALMFIFIEVRLKLDRLMLYFGILASALCGFDAIQVTGLTYTGEAGALFWARLQHGILASAGLAFVAYVLVLCRERKPLLLGITAAWAVSIAVLSFSPWFLDAAPGGPIAHGPIYLPVILPFLALVAGSGFYFLGVNLPGSKGEQRLNIVLQIIGLAYVAVMSGIDIALQTPGDPANNRFAGPSITASGILVYVLAYCFITAVTLVNRLVVIIHERRFALRDALVQRERSEQLLADFTLVLGSAIESRDLCTGSHVTRVAEYSRAISRKLGLDEVAARGVYLGAVVHDLGKIGIRDEVLNKPGRLSDHELVQMRTHPRVGRELLDRLHEFETAKNIALCHHERWDGGGYPSGLRHEAIPVEARIVCVADYWDAIITDRPYRKAMVLSEALDLMKHERGGAFDPAICDVFLDPREGIYLMFMTTPEQRPVTGPGPVPEFAVS